MPKYLVQRHRLYPKKKKKNSLKRKGKIILFSKRSDKPAILMKRSRVYRR